MNYWQILLAFAVFYGIHMALSMRQMSNFSRTYGRLREHGKVAIGKHQNLFTRGAIVMFRLDEDGGIREGVYLTGVTVFSRFREFPAFDGVRIRDLRRLVADRPRLPKAVRQAVVNADDNYTAFTAGRMPEEPPGPFARIGARFSRKSRVGKEN